MADPNPPAPADSAQVGEQIGGYRLLSRLGDGSTSTVFLGEHVRLGRRSAIKVLARDHTDDQRTVERLLNEARVVNDIRHPNIVDISDFVEQDAPRRVALVMEYIEGPSLETFRGDPLPTTQALALSLQLVDAVQAAHARGVIHRDLKPANLLLTFDPHEPSERPLELKVVDFGIAKIEGPQGQGMTVSGTMLGTPAYMSPEQIVGSPPPSAATDVFALGAVIYELLSGVRAYPSPRLQETVRMKLRGELPELEPPDMPGGDRLVELVAKCLARNPAARPALAAVRSRLDRLLRAAAGEHMTDALEIPTMGLTAAAPVPAAATELSEIPAGAVLAAREAAEHAATELPELMALLEAQEDDHDDDEVGTELARPSLDLPAFDLATEQASANAPRWSQNQKDVATSMAGEGIPDHASSPTNRVLDALTHEVTEPPVPAEPTHPGDLGFGGLLGPAGVADPGPEGDHPTRTVPKVDALDTLRPEPSTVPPPAPVAPAPSGASSRDLPRVPDTSPSQPSADRLAVAVDAPATPPRARRADAELGAERPDKLFASGVGLGPEAEAEARPPPSSRDLPSPPPERSGAKLLLTLLAVLLVAACVVGAAVLGGALDVPMSEEPAPIEREAPPKPPSATPR